MRQRWRTSNRTANGRATTLGLLTADPAVLLAASRPALPAQRDRAGLRAEISLRVKANSNPFQDEGLYLFMGHRMIDHIVSGVHLSEYPGSYFSGAPGLYPVVGAIADSVAGVQGARLVSLFFVCIAIIATYGIGNELFGKLAGLLGAGAFALCGSVVFISHLATLDAMALCLMSLGCWLTVYSANHDKLLWAPISRGHPHLGIPDQVCDCRLRTGDRCHRDVAGVAPHSLGSTAACVSGRERHRRGGVLRSHVLGRGSEDEELSPQRRIELHCPLVLETNCSGTSSSGSDRGFCLPCWAR